MASEHRFDVGETFDEDYLHFYAEVLTEERSDEQADVLWRFLDLEAGTAVLDLACGHGRIANRLAARGARVTGLDATPLYLDIARRDAESRGVDVEYVQGDMRRLPWRERFQAAALVFTAFGYFGDEDNRLVLRQLRGALQPGGRLWIDTLNPPALFASFRESVVVERDGDLMVDRIRYDPLTGRSITDRTVVQGGRQRSFRFSVRLLTFTELRDWLLEAGFSEVAGHCASGEPLTAASPRLAAVARA